MKRSVYRTKKQKTKRKEECTKGRCKYNFGMDRNFQSMVTEGLGERKWITSEGKGVLNDSKVYISRVKYFVLYVLFYETPNSRDPSEPRICRPMVFTQSTFFSTDFWEVVVVTWSSPPLPFGETLFHRSIDIPSRPFK